MPRTRIDSAGSLNIEWSDGEFTNVQITWQETLTDGTDSMTERMSKTIPVKDLSVAELAKLSAAVFLAQGLREPLP